MKKLIFLDYIMLPVNDVEKVVKEINHYRHCLWLIRDAAKKNRNYQRQRRAGL